jgi:hypothetical protein
VLLEKAWYLRLSASLLNRLASILSLYI